jgi:hypothetical protein
MSVAINQPFFTVYLSNQGIELRPGYEDYPHCQALHTSKSYESAQEFAQAAASHRNLPMKSWVDSDSIHVK